MTRLLVIRHGETDWNTAGLIQGHTDRPLSDAGRRAFTGMRLSEEWADVSCLSSPLQRAMDTAKLLGLEPKPEPRLIEMAWGEWEGRSLQDLRKAFGAAMLENEAKGLDFRPPGGESPRDVQARLKPLLARITGPTIFVTHKGVLRALYALATHWTMMEEPPDKLLNGRAHAFDVSADGAPSIAELNIALERRA